MTYQLIFVGNVYKDYGIERKRKIALKSKCCVGGVIEVLEVENKKENFKKKLYRCSICKKVWENEEDINDYYKSKSYIQTVREYSIIKGCTIKLVDLYVK